MKALIVFAALLYSVMASASEKYIGTFYSRHIGVMVLQMEFSFKSGEVVEGTADYYREHFDQGQWGDWICENKAVFHRSVAITGALYRGNGELIGTFQNNRSDQKRGRLILSSLKSSAEEFECSLFSLESEEKVWFQGYDSYVREKSFTLSFGIPGSYLKAQSTEEKGTYVLNQVDINAILRNQRNQIYYSLTYDQGGNVAILERGSIGLKTPK